MKKIPQINLGSLSVSRLIAGSNQISGFSHQSAERSKEMMDYFTSENIKKFFTTCELNGINTVVARCDAFIMRILREYWNEGGKIQWIAQTAKEYRDIYQNINEAFNNGASAISIHGGITDKLFEDKQEQTIADIVRYVKKDLKLSIGVAAHNPLNLLKIQEMNVDTDFYMVCMYNITGYQGKRGVEKVEIFDDTDRLIALDTLPKLKRPCVMYKVLAAGRKQLDEGLLDIRKHIRPTDGVLIGMYPKDDPEIVEKNVQAIRDLNC